METIFWDLYTTDHDVRLDLKWSTWSHDILPYLIILYMVIKSNKPISHAYFYSSKCVVIQYWDRSCCNCIVNILQMVLWSKNKWVSDAIKLVYQSLKEHTFDFHKWVVQIFNTDLDSFPALCVGLQIWVSLDLFNVQIRSIFTSSFRSFFLNLYIRVIPFLPHTVKCCSFAASTHHNTMMIRTWYKP